ncbi:MAG: hypothetical protein WCX27_01320 [Candidatus Paceibacterota bacterium]|jgi:hypothetical protein
MSNGNFERMSKLYTKVSMLVMDGKRNADLVSDKLQEILEEKQRVLDFLGTVSIPATSGKFIVKDKFAVNTADKSKVIISGTGSNFDEWFLGKTEKPIAKQELHYAKLLKRSADGPIIEELGGEAKAETTLSEMYSLMENQKDGRDGVLLNNGSANIFYIKDKNEVLRAVGVHWRGDGWCVDADSVEDPDAWYDGGQFFSRN